MAENLTLIEILCMKIQDDPEQSIQYYIDHAKSIDDAHNITKREFRYILGNHIGDMSRKIDIVIGNDLLTLTPEEIIILKQSGFKVANKARKRIGLKQIDYPGKQMSHRPGRKNKYTFKY